MTWAQVAEIAAPSITALGGAVAGSQLAATRAEKAELRALLDDATAALERATQKRGAAFVLTDRDGVATTAETSAAIASFRSELSEASQLRFKMVHRTKRGAAISVHYLNALLAL